MDQNININGNLLKLQQIRTITLRIFILIGLPRETYGERIDDIVNNLREIYLALHKIYQQINQQSHTINTITNTTHDKLALMIENQNITGLSQLFEE